MKTKIKISDENQLESYTKNIKSYETKQKLNEHHIK